MLDQVNPVADVFAVRHAGNRTLRTTETETGIETGTGPVYRIPNERRKIPQLIAVQKTGDPDFTVQHVRSNSYNEGKRITKEKLNESPK
jgi:hypothetical protein